MKLIGIMPARNEEWMLGFSLRAALKWCDMVIVLVHASTDRTEEIACEAALESGNRAHVLADESGKWDEMRHRQTLLDVARTYEPSHIAIIDADEVLTANLLPVIRDQVENTPPGHILQLPGYNLRGSHLKYHDSGIWGARVFSLAFRDSPELNWAGDRFHHREPMGAALKPFRIVPHGKGGVMHFWGADERRLRAKHALYKLTERVRWPEKRVADIDEMYSLAVHGNRHSPPASWRYADVPAAWLSPYGPIMREHYCPDVEPWQIAECRRILAERPELAEGLDLFGVNAQSTAGV